MHKKMSALVGEMRMLSMDLSSSDVLNGFPLEFFRGKPGSSASSLLMFAVLGRLRCHRLSSCKVPQSWARIAVGVKDKSWPEFKG